MLHHVTHQKQPSTDCKADSLHGGMTNNTQYVCAAVIQNLKNVKFHFRDTFIGSKIYNILKVAPTVTNDSNPLTNPWWVTLF